MRAAATPTNADIVVLHAATTYPRATDDGVPRFVADLVDALRETGCSVDVAAPDGRAGVLAALSRPWTWPRAIRSLWSLWRKLRRTARAPRRSRPRIVHAHWWPVATMALLAGHRDVVVTMHGSDVGLLGIAPMRAIARWTLRRTRARICVSRFLADEVEAMTSVPVEHVIAHGTSGGEMQEVVAADDPVVFVGSLTRKKGAHDLPEIVAAMRDAGATNPVHVIGDGPLSSNLADELEVLPDATGVTLLGRLSHAATMDAIASAAAMICPSYFEGYGLACREAIERGTSVLAYRTGGLAEQVRPGTDGDLSEPGDTQTLGRLLAATCLDLELRQVRRSRAMSSSTSAGSWADVAAQVLQVYETVMAVAPPAAGPAMRPSNSR